MDINEFMEKFCKKCNDNCDKGMIERKDFIRCIDRDIYVDKKVLKNN